MKEKIESIVAYELDCMASGALYPINKVINYFGAEEVCKAYGCTKSSMTLAEELVRIVFNEIDK